MSVITKSKTIDFNLAMGMVEAIHGSLQLFQPVMTVEQFAAFSLIIGMVHAIGGVYLRTITTKALSEK